MRVPRLIRSASLLLATFLVSSPLAAQGGSVEFGTFGQGTRYDAAMNFDDALGAGIHFGFGFMSFIGIEADVGWGQSTYQGTTDAAQLSARGRLMITPGFGSFNLLLGGGGVYNSYDYAPGAWETGVTGIAGFEAGIMGPIRLRVAGVYDYMPSTTLSVATGSSHAHMAAQVGLSVKLNPGGGGGGGGRAAQQDAAPAANADADGDGVPDASDMCANTPGGVNVDGRGCTVAPTDSDNDGVPDGTDQCANTPQGTSVNAAGCPLPPADSDGDGVPDPSDQCANTPAGARVTPNGCPVPETPVQQVPVDTDGDGVPDASDNCAGTPAGTAVNASGCPLPPPDSDGDGVPDTSDQCANTAPGTAVSPNGCPIPPRDADGDGVPDTDDVCADTPPGTAVRSNGCPVPPADSDADGVPDTRDECANTAPGAAVGANGCPLPPPDTDLDGVPDADDRCPSTASGTAVGADGCPLAVVEPEPEPEPEPVAPPTPVAPADTDMDGIPDTADRCPSTAAGTEVGADGCPVPEPEPEPAPPPVEPEPEPEPEPTPPPAPMADAAGAVTIQGVRFVRNSDGITFPVRPVLNALADSLNALPGGRWEIAAHTDEGDSEAASQDLSQRRADEVRNYLIGRGVSPDRLTARGYGRTSMAGQTRRVELRPIN